MWMCWWRDNLSRPSCNETARRGHAAVGPKRQNQKVEMQVGNDIATKQEPVHAAHPKAGTLGNQKKSGTPIIRLVEALCK